MKEFIVEENKTYCISDENVAKLESGEIGFKTNDGVAVIPSYCGRGGTVFHCTFKKLVNPEKNNKPFNTGKRVNLVIMPLKWRF